MRGKPNVVIIDRDLRVINADVNDLLIQLRKKRIVAMVCLNDRCIIARFNVNKNTLKKLI